MPHNQIEPLELLYRNGEATSTPKYPRFSDICLTKESQDSCESAINKAANYEHAIRSDRECQDYIELHSWVDEVLDEVRQLAKKDREPLVKIMSQIAAALEPIQNKLIKISQHLNQQISQWRALVVEGQRKEQERLEHQANEKRNEAKYTDDPKKRRQAKVQAEQLEKEAKAAAPKVEKGVDTEEYFEGGIINRVIAAKLPDDIVVMDVDQGPLNRYLKARQRAGEKITPNILPGLNIERKTRVRFHK